MVEVLDRIVPSSRLVTSVSYHANKLHYHPQAAMYPDPNADTSGMDEEEQAEILELLQVHYEFQRPGSSRGFEGEAKGGG